MSPSATHAGGWGVTTIDHWPQNVVAGKPVTVTFVVRQHGIHPITEIGPVFEFRNLSTGETFQARSKVQPRLVRFITTFTFPSAGEWRWEVTSWPQQQMPNVTVHATAPTTPASTDGKTLFVAKGCSMCHAHSAAMNSGELYGVDGAPSLSPNKWDAEYLRVWLKAPKTVKPLTKMPNLGLRDKEIDALVTFLTAKP
ncbi:MAG: c-type cytochrome [Anaerolineae bacterium]|nr:c-type cytochrome [Anaerolineae bacterium]